MELDNKLTILDFTKGIRSSEINHNFSVIKGWIERERLRSCGWGIVEGFEFSYPNNDFVVNIGEGTFINSRGEEVFIDPAKIKCDAPRYEQYSEILQVSDDGKIKLKYRPYSPKKLGVIHYLPPDYITKPDLNELTIIDSNDTTTKIRPISVVDNTVTISATDFGGHTVKVNYYYCDDRIDAFLLDSDGRYHKETGILSTNPSKTNIDLTDMYIIGFAHWIISDNISVEFIVDGRTYRKVYVDKNNVLYLNGKIYKDPKWIYFEIPDSPEENDVYYDKKNNALMIYINGEWVVMNDFTTSSLRSLKMWNENECPADLQTFMFADDELDLRFIPNKNCLEIIIDQQVLMADQYTEIVQPGAKSYLSAGIGFRLNEPLDRATVVQCTVNHNIKNGPLTNVFQRAAIFTYENSIIYSEANVNKLFECQLDYVTNSNQLEVFVNGHRLIRDIDFWELKPDGSTKTNDNENTTYFKIIRNLNAGDVVLYKISRYVWSYDQLNLMMQDIENTAKQALTTANENVVKIDNINTNVADLENNINQRIEYLENQLNTLSSSCRYKNDKITINDIDDTIKSKLVENFETVVFSAIETVTGTAIIPNLTDKDILYINYINGDITTKLIEGENADYIVVHNKTDNTAQIVLRPELIADSANIIIDILRIGA